MRGRNLLIAVVVLVVLIVIAIFVMKEPPHEQITASFPKVEKDKVTKVWIKTPIKEQKEKGNDSDAGKVTFEEVTLEKQNGDKAPKWMVTSPVLYEAYQSYVDSMISRLEELKIESIAAENKTSYSTLEIDADHATEVKVYEGEKLLTHFLVGGYKGGATMVRFPNDEKVYRVRGSINYLFAKPVRDWREKRIIDIENDNVTRLEFVNSNGSFTFSKVENNWKNLSQTPIPDYDSKKISGFVSTIAHLRASDFEDKLKPEEAGLGVGAASVTVFYTEKKKDSIDAATGEDIPQDEEAVEANQTKQEIILIGNQKDSSNYYIKLKDKPQIFLISKYTAERLTPTADKFSTPPKKESAKTLESKSSEEVSSTPDASTDATSIPPEVMKKIQAEIKKQQMLKQLTNQAK